MIVLLRSAIAFCREEFDIWLFGGEEVHGVSLLISNLFVFGSVLVLFPERLVGKTVVETGVGKGAKGEGGQEACFVCFPEVVGGFEGVFVVYEVVGC